MDPKLLIDYSWKNSKPEQDRYRTRLQQIRQKNPALMSENEVLLRQKTKQLEQLIRSKKLLKQDFQKDQEQLANNYSVLKKYDADPLYRATPRDEQRYAGIHRIYFNPKEAHDRLTDTDLDLGDLFTKAKYAKQNGPQNVLTKDGREIPYGDALRQVANKLGVSMGDAQRFLSQRMAGNVPKRVLTAAVRTDQTGEFDEDEQFTNPSASKRQVRKQQLISAYTTGPVLGQIVKKLKPQIKGFTTAAEGRFRVQKQQLEALIRRKEDSKQDATAERRQLEKTYGELQKINKDPHYLATKGEIERNARIVRIMLDPKATAQTLMDQNLDLSDLYGETKQLESQGTAARANAKVRTLDGDIVDYDVALDRVGSALGLSRSDVFRLLKGHFGKDIRKLYTTVATHISKQLPNGLDRKNLVEKEEGGLNKGQTAFSTAVQDDAITRNPDLAQISDAEGYWRNIQDGFNNPLSILANTLEGSMNKGHFRSDKERSDLENIARFVGDLGTQMLATGGPKVLGPKALELLRLTNLVNKANGAFKGLKAVQFGTNLLLKGEQGLNKLGAAGNVLRMGGRFVAGNAIGTATEASKYANLNHKSYGEAFGDVAKNQAMALLDPRYILGYDENHKPLDFTERMQGALNQFAMLRDAGHIATSSPHALKLAMKWVPELEKLKDSPIVGATLTAQAIQKMLPKHQQAKFEAFAKAKLSEAADKLLNPQKLSEEAKRYGADFEKALAEDFKKTHPHEDAASVAKDTAALWSAVFDASMKHDKLTPEQAAHRFGLPTVHAVDEADIPANVLYQKDKTAAQRVQKLKKEGWTVTEHGHGWLDTLDRSGWSAVVERKRDSLKKGQVPLATRGDWVLVQNPKAQGFSRYTDPTNPRNEADLALWPATVVTPFEEGVVKQLTLHPDKPFTGTGAPENGRTYNELLRTVSEVANPDHAFWFTKAGKTFLDIVGHENLNEAMHAWGALSAGTDVPRNFQGALKALILKRQHPGASAEELTHLFLNDPFVAHPGGKMSNYGKNSRTVVENMFKGLLNPEQHRTLGQGQKTENYQGDTLQVLHGGPKNTSTNDRHMKDAFGYTDPSKGFTPVQYQFVSTVVNAMSKRLGITPGMVQSLLWAQTKIGKGQGSGAFEEAATLNPNLMAQAKAALKGKPDSMWSGTRVHNEVPVAGQFPTLLNPSPERITRTVGDKGGNSLIPAKVPLSHEGLLPLMQDLGIAFNLGEGSMDGRNASHISLPGGLPPHTQVVHGLGSILGMTHEGRASTGTHPGDSGIDAVAVAGHGPALQRIAHAAGVELDEFSQHGTSMFRGPGGRDLTPDEVESLVRLAKQHGFEAEPRRLKPIAPMRDMNDAVDLVREGGAHLWNFQRNPKQVLEGILRMGRIRDRELGLGGEKQVAEMHQALRGGAWHQDEDGSTFGAFSFKPPTETEAAQVGIYFTKGKANASTSLHEAVGHYLFETIGEEARQKMAKAMGFAEVDRDATEQFVRHFERYVRSGRAPNAQLKQAFKSFRSWLTQIYGHLRGTPLEKKIPREVRKKFEQMLGANLEGGKNYRPPVGRTWGPPIPYKVLPLHEEEDK